MPLNDAHCHFFSSRFFETLARDAGGRFDADPAVTVPAALGWEAPGTPQQLANRWMTEIDRHQVNRAVLIASVPGDEPSVAAALVAHPAAFVGFFMVNPLAEDAVATHAGRDSGARPARRVPVSRRCTGTRCSTRAWPRSWRRRLQHRTRRCSSTAACSRWGYARSWGSPAGSRHGSGQPLDVQVLASAWPKVPFIIPHFGAGFFREALMAGDMCANIHLDTSSSNGWMKYIPGLTLEAVFRQAIQVLGPERLLFGTDSSFFPRGWQRPVFDTQVAALDRLGLKAAEVDLILGGNFDRLFPLGSIARRRAVGGKRVGPPSAGPFGFAHALALCTVHCALQLVRPSGLRLCTAPPRRSRMLRTLIAAVIALAPSPPPTPCRPRHRVPPIGRRRSSAITLTGCIARASDGKSFILTQQAGAPGS